VGLRVLLCSADRMTEPVILESRASATPAIGRGS
jgi:hypothetical protein